MIYLITGGFYFDHFMYLFVERRNFSTASLLLNTLNHDQNYKTAILQIVPSTFIALLLQCLLTPNCFVPSVSAHLRCGDIPRSVSVNLLIKLNSITIARHLFISHHVAKPMLPAALPCPPILVTVCLVVVNHFVFDVRVVMNKIVLHHVRIKLV